MAMKIVDKITNLDSVIEVLALLSLNTFLEQTNNGVENYSKWTLSCYRDSEWVNGMTC